jgi:Sulfatase
LGSQESVAGNQPPTWRRRELRYLAELSGLCGLAIALPTLDVLGRNPDFLVLEHLSTRDVVALALATALLPPLVLWGLGLAAGLAGQRLRRAVHLVTVAGLLVAVAVQLGKHLTPLSGLPLAVAAAVAGTGLLLLYRRTEIMGWLLRLLAPVPVLAMALFLFVSSAKVLVLPEDAPAAGPAAASTGASPPIVVLAFDELPLISLLDTTGRVDPVNYPNFAWLAERSTWYRNATGVTTWTRDAYPSMLTGRWPARPEAAHYRSYPDNLFTLLDDRYELNVHEVASVMCPPPGCNDSPTSASAGPWRAIKRTGRLAAEIVSPFEQATEPSAELYQPEAKRTAANGKPTVPAGFPEFLAGLRPSAEPRLSYVHLLLPHRPWKYLPSGLRYPETQRALGFASRTANWPDTLVWPKLARYRHRLQLAYADRLLGQTLQTLQGRGLLDQSVVVVTADHGISFLPNTHPRVATEKSNPQIMWVPLFVKAAGQQDGRIDDRNWQHVDLLPTLADYAKVEVGWKLDGRSVFDPPRSDTEKRWYVVRDKGPPSVVRVDGPSGQRIALKGTLPAHLEVRPQLGAPPGQHLSRLGLRPDLIGDQLAEAKVTNAGGLPAVIKGLERFEKVNLEAGEVPALVVGQAPAGMAKGTKLALALNGQITTVAEVAPEGKDKALRFGGMLAGELFRSGANQLDVLVIDGDRLRRLSLEGT